MNTCFTGACSLEPSAAHLPPGTPVSCSKPFPQVPVLDGETEGTRGSRRPAADIGRALFLRRRLALADLGREAGGEAGKSQRSWGQCENKAKPTQQPSEDLHLSGSIINKQEWGKLKVRRQTRANTSELPNWFPGQTCLSI